MEEHIVLLTLLFDQSKQLLDVGSMQQTLTQETQNVILDLPFQLFIYFEGVKGIFEFTLKI